MNAKDFLKCQPEYNITIKGSVFHNVGTTILSVLMDKYKNSQTDETSLEFIKKQYEYSIHLEGNRSAEYLLLFEKYESTIESIIEFSNIIERYKRKNNAK